VFKAATHHDTRGHERRIRFGRTLPARQSRRVNTQRCRRFAQGRAAPTPCFCKLQRSRSQITRHRPIPSAGLRRRDRLPELARPRIHGFYRHRLPPRVRVRARERSANFRRGSRRGTASTYARLEADDARTRMLRLRLQINADRLDQHQKLGVWHTDELGENEEQRRFAAHLLHEVDRECAAGSDSER